LELLYKLFIDKPGFADNPFSGAVNHHTPPAPDLTALPVSSNKTC